jgi:hypothetical protein
MGEPDDDFPKFTSIGHFIAGPTRPGSVRGGDRRQFADHLRPDDYAGIGIGLVRNPAHHLRLRSATMNTWRRLPGVFACLHTLLATALGSIAFAQVPLNLPPGATTPIANVATDQSLPSFASVQFTELPPGYDVADQTYLGWCAAPNASLLVSQTSPGSPIWSENNAVYRMLNTYPGTGADSTLPPDAQNSAWPMVNWLLNNEGGASGTVAATLVDIQEAIWFLLQGAYVADPPFTGSFDPNNPTVAAMQLVGDAKANGGSFVPGPGQVVAVLLYGVSQPGNSGPPQDLVFEVNRVADWEMFHHDLSHTGLSQADTSANKGKQKWTFKTGDWVRQSSPAVGPDGTIYVGSYDENLYAITPVPSGVRLELKVA